MAENVVTRRMPISVKDLNIATGTWTYTVSSGAIYMLKTATDETSTVTFTLPIPRRSDQFGVRLRKVIMPIRVITADLDAAPTCVLYRVDQDLVVAGATGDHAVATITTTDNGVVTADAQDRDLTITVSDPIWDHATEASCHYNVSVALNCGGSTVVRIYPPYAEYDELV